jgi:hypothetical protein
MLQQQSRVRQKDFATLEERAKVWIGRPQLKTVLKTKFQIGNNEVTVNFRKKEIKYFIHPRTKQH